MFFIILKDNVYLLCLYKSQHKCIYITADIYRMLNPTALLATLIHVLWADVSAGHLGVLRLRMSVPREEGNLSYDQLLPLPVRPTKAAWGNSDSFMASCKCWALLLSFLSYEYRESLRNKDSWGCLLAREKKTRTHLLSSYQVQGQGINMFHLTDLQDKTSLVAQMVKTLSTMWEIQVRSLHEEDPLEKGIVTHCCTLPSPRSTPSPEPTIPALESSAGAFI